MVTGTQTKLTSYPELKDGPRMKKCFILSTIVCLSIYRGLFLYIYLSIYLGLFMSIYLSFFLFIYLSIYLLFLSISNYSYHSLFFYRLLHSLFSPRSVHSLFFSRPDHSIFFFFLGLFYISFFTACSLAHFPGHIFFLLSLVCPFPRPLLYLSFFHLFISPFFFRFVHFLFFSRPVHHSLLFSAYSFSLFFLGLFVLSFFPVCSFSLFSLFVHSLFFFSSVHSLLFSVLFILYSFPRLFVIYPKCLYHTHIYLSIYLSIYGIFYIDIKFWFLSIYLSIYL
ncbi:unnamed protein product [Acanthosepion pharaonis]|uniref:Uncharacterized protein n=1 Tax=Acanthosepion pharaonis TaxID=158019 RepID=A0A812BQE8_ACAPH|nr:unnamed protein product [Sepia pharaonis]